MCGRYSFAHLSTEVEKRFKIQVDGNTYIATYNAAPTQKLAVITNFDADKLSFFHWGLIPSWAQDERMASQMINARTETLEEKPSFQSAFKTKRCLIPADGFYEWKKNGNQKTPHFIRLKTKEIFSFAGLWEEWKSKEGELRRTFTIITTPANDLMKPIHDRMPAILPRNLEKEWLQNPDPRDLNKMLTPFESRKMEAFEVSSQVNKVINNHPGLIQAFSGGQQAISFNE
ncbi:MAG: SOS response-associated peptidase [Bacteroidales bacterium]|nr:SOS response-associated peptidase [Bacteroidales bacterium]